jgi:hypothetical protein
MGFSLETLSLSFPALSHKVPTSAGKAIADGGDRLKIRADDRSAGRNGAGLRSGLASQDAVAQRPRYSERASPGGLLHRRRAPGIRPMQRAPGIRVQGSSARCERFPMPSESSAL